VNSDSGNASPFLTKDLLDTHTDFVIYCIEEYKARKNLSGKEVIQLFKKHDVINFIRTCYEILHIEGGPAICQRIDEAIQGSSHTA
jgi:hypothetical protein